MTTDDNIVDVRRLKRYHNKLKSDVLKNKLDKKPIATDDDIDAILNGEIMASDSDIDKLFV